MASPKKIVIGTRGSDLALKQAGIVASALKSAAGLSLEIETRVITTKGDVDQNPIPLDTVGKGWFTQEIEDQLLGGTIDIAVHSLKDLAEDMPSGLTLAAYLPREDARDALIIKTGKGNTLEELPQGARVGTDSARRQIQMLALRPDLTMKSLRGNVPTRLGKLETEAYDAIILAAAGLKRLSLESHITRYFQPSEMTPAPGQGILAIQARTDDTTIRSLLELVNDSDANHAADIERAFARETGGGCKSPVGAYAFRDGDEWCLIGMIANEDGTKKILREKIRAPWDKSDNLGELLARKLLAQIGKNHDA